MITAENDPVPRPEMAEPMRPWIPELRIAHIKRGSHWTQQEKPEGVNALIFNCIADLR